MYFLLVATSRLKNMLPTMLLKEGMKNNIQIVSNNWVQLILIKNCELLDATLEVKESVVFQ